MVRQLAGKVALVTGAGSGIGRATAQRFAIEGAHVVVSDVNVESGQETVRLIGEEATFIGADMRNAKAIARLVTQSVATYGRLDVVHSNAGALTLVQSIDEVTEELWRQNVEINLTAHFLLFKAALQALEVNRGAFVCTSSSAALDHFVPGPHYTAAKYGILGMVRSLAALLPSGRVRLNVICPGGVDTNLVVRPTKRFDLLKPEDVARGVLYLATQPSLHGAVLLAHLVDGTPTYGLVRPYAVDPVHLTD